MFLLSREAQCTAWLSTGLARLSNLHVVHLMLSSASNITKFNERPDSLDAGNQPDKIDAVSSTPLPMSRMTRISFSGPPACRTGRQSLRPERSETANRQSLHPPALHIASPHQQDGSYSLKRVHCLCQGTAESQYSPRFAYHLRRDINARTLQ